MVKKPIAVIGAWLFFNFPAYAILPEPEAPVWNDLTPAEQQVLAPIGAEFDSLTPLGRRNFRGTAQRYGKLTPIQQLRFQSRLIDWAKLKPEERKTAREKYKQFKELPAEKRKELKEKWRQQQEAKKKAQQNKTGASGTSSAAQSATPSIPNSASALKQPNTIQYEQDPE
jgi:hypothetical protein